MTKVPVNVPNLMPNTSYKAGKVQETDTKSDFSKIFENQKSVSAEEKVRDNSVSDDVAQSQDDLRSNVKGEPAKDVTDTQKTNTVEKTTQKQDAQTNAEDETSEGELSEEEMNAIMPMLLNASADVKELLVQELGISKEELNALMESMGLTATDLLDKANLKELVLQAMGVTDMTALLTDEGLYQQMQSLEADFAEIMESVQETLQLTDEEMNALKEQISEMGKSGDALMTQENVADALKVDETESKQTEEQTSHGNNANYNANQNFAAINQNGFVTQNNTVTYTQMAQQTSLGSAVGNEQIMQQVVDYMKVQLNADTSTLEMQLHPESMGTLHIRILEKEGVMTAQFTTTSETVKVALEGQMIQLLQQFDDQNIKVEAIEVAVSTGQQFDNAMMQGEDARQAQSDKRGRTRRINLNALDGVDASEDYSEEDKVVVEMMAANGNTVDYLA